MTTRMIEIEIQADDAAYVRAESAISDALANAGLADCDECGKWIAEDETHEVMGVPSLYCSKCINERR